MTSPIWTVCTSLSNEYSYQYNYYIDQSSSPKPLGFRKTISWYMYKIYEAILCKKYYSETTTDELYIFILSKLYSLYPTKYFYKSIYTKSAKYFGLLPCMECLSSCRSACQCSPPHYTSYYLSVLLLYIGTH